MIYKPGKINIVADALSRQNLNNITDDSSEMDTQHSAESSDNTQLKKLKNL